MYTVHMVNFNMNKGTFPTLEQAVAQAKALGFDCAIWKEDPNVASSPEFVKSVKPY
jgi:hypothetical protein